MKGDGIKQCGKKGGKLQFRVRLLGQDPATGEKVLDTKRLITAASRQEARAKRDKMQAEALQKKLGVWADVEPSSFKEAREAWIKTYDRPGTVGTWGSYARTIGETFDKRPIGSITQQQAQSYFNKLTGSKSRRSGFRTVFAQIFDWAILHGHASSPNPIRAVRLVYKTTAAERMEAVENPPKKHLLRDEIPVFLAAMREHNPRLERLFVAMLSIGARAAEGVAIKRSDVDWTTGEVRIVRGVSRGELDVTKGNKARTGTFAPIVLDMLRAHVAEMDDLQWPGHDVWLFPGRPTGRKRKQQTWPYLTLYRAVKAVEEATGIRLDNATHAIRHTTAALVKGGVEDSVMRAVMGWTTAQMQDVYGVPETSGFADVVGKALGRPGGNKSGNRVDKSPGEPVD